MKINILYFKKSKNVAFSSNKFASLVHKILVNALSFAPPYSRLRPVTKLIPFYTPLIKPRLIFAWFTLSINS